MNTIDYRQVFREVYTPPREGIVRITIPPRRCLAVDGEGELSSSAFMAAATAVRRLDKAIRRHIKRGPMALDFRPMPLEVQWHDMQHWTVMVFQPPVVDASLVETKRQALSAESADVVLRHLPEAPALQTLHAGSAASMHEALERLQAFALNHGLQFTDDYLAIDLGDVRKPPFSGNAMLVRRELRI